MGNTLKINLKNKTALITGASKGLGKEILKRFIDLGVNCHAVSRSEDIFQIKNESFDNANQTNMVNNDF